MHRATVQDPSLRPTRGMKKVKNGHMANVFEMWSMVSLHLLLFHYWGDGSRSQNIL